MVHLKLTVVVLTAIAGTAFADIYCAKWNTPGTSGVLVVETRKQEPAIVSLTGNFDASIVSTLPNVNTSALCPSGLNLHLHAGWTGIPGESSSTCGTAATLTFNHYDPSMLVLQTVSGLPLLTAIVLPLIPIDLLITAVLLPSAITSTAAKLETSPENLGELVTPAEN
jgi:hypothetical protein